MEKIPPFGGIIAAYWIYYSPLILRLSRAELYICCFSGEKFADANLYWMAFIHTRARTAILQKNFGKIV